MRYSATITKGHRIYRIVFVSVSRLIVVQRRICHGQRTAIRSAVDNVQKAKRLFCKLTFFLNAYLVAEALQLRTVFRALELLTSAVRQRWSFSHSNII